MTRWEFEEMYGRVKDEILTSRKYYPFCKGLSPKSFRCSKLTTKNRLLLVCIWLGSYLKYSSLGFQFGISKALVCMEIRHIIPIILCAYMKEVVMPQHLNTLQGSSNISKLIIGALDATHFEISKPGIDQAVFYQRHLIDQLKQNGSKSKFFKTSFQKAQDFTD